MRHVALVTKRKVNGSNKLVTISNECMRVYNARTAPKKIVFLSGGLTSSSILDCKALYTKLVSTFQIVAVEKSRIKKDLWIDIQKELSNASQNKQFF